MCESARSTAAVKRTKKARAREQVKANFFFFAYVHRASIRARWDIVVYLLI